MKKILMLFGILLLLCGCSNSNPDALKFKQDYEKLNGQTTESGNKYREVEIDAKNPFVYVELDEVLRRMDNGETFIVYFGANWCPWCRSILPTVIKTARELKVDKIYYVDVRKDNDHDLDIRDSYAVDESGRIYLSHEGTEAYHKFIERASEVLADYSREDVPTLDGTEFEGAKRVGAPNFVLIEKGQAVNMITGISSLQSDPYQELNDDILQDVSDMFTKLFEQYLKGR
ncbi:MAG: hypothetical protein IJJ19_05195 [Erysipelotrichaceae bacterium]|nr:hypothetical protein [Erysipelotrichaceae bacterium]